MEEVFLSSDVLIHYFKQPEAGETDRHEQATAVMKRVYAEELTVHLTDITLFQVLKFLLEVDVSELTPELYEEHREYFFQDSYSNEEYIRSRARRYLMPLLELPNVIISDKEKWEDVFYHLHIGFDWRIMPVYIEAAYNTTAFISSEEDDKRTLQGIVTFERLHDIPRIDPATFE
jgi:hypothetical protein